MIPSGTIITPELRSLWLSERRDSIGSSDIYRLVSGDYLDVYMDKTGAKPIEEETFSQWFGLAMEATLARAYERHTGRIVAREQVFRRNDLNPRHTATIDGELDDRNTEWKTVNAYNREIIKELGDEDSDEIPRRWMWQAQWGMYCRGVDRCDVVPLIGGRDFRVYPLERHDELISIACKHADLILKMIDACTQPAPNKPGDVKHYGQLFPTPKGEISLGYEMEARWERYREIGEQVKELESERQACKLAIEDAMKEAGVARFPGGSGVKRTVSVPFHKAKEAHYGNPQTRLYNVKG